MSAEPLSAPLCSIDDIPDGGSAGLDPNPVTGIFRLIAVRREDKVYLYKNICPHTDSPLDFRPGMFLNSRRDLILCSTHGALFRIESGACLAGPCDGQGLKAVPHQVRDGKIYLIS